MILLAIDCAASLCAACVYDADAGRELGRCVLDIDKGHAEHLMAVIAEALTSAGRTYADLCAIAVSVGPGSFTGIRVGVSAVRGFALALKIPAVGINTLEALAEEASPQASGGPVMAALTAAADQAYVGVYQTFADVVYHPSRITLEEAAILARRNVVLTGTAADAIASRMTPSPTIVGRAATADISIYAQIAARRGPGVTWPSPLYLREPDAKPRIGFVLPRERTQ